MVLRSIPACEFCGVELSVDEVLLCGSCLEFFKWKYGSLERFDQAYCRVAGREESCKKQ
jgi:hypothetical protein